MAAAASPPPESELPAAVAALRERVRTEDYLTLLGLALPCTADWVRTAAAALRAEVAEFSPAEAGGAPAAQQTAPPAPGPVAQQGPLAEQGLVSPLQAAVDEILQAVADAEAVLTDPARAAYAALHHGAAR